MQKFCWRKANQSSNLLKQHITIGQTCVFHGDTIPWNLNTGQLWEYLEFWDNKESRYHLNSLWLSCFLHQISMGVLNGNNYTFDDRVQFLLSTNSKMWVISINALYLLVLWCISCQFKCLHDEVLQDGCTVHGGHHALMPTASHSRFQVPRI